MAAGNEVDCEFAPDQQCGLCVRQFHPDDDLKAHQLLCGQEEIREQEAYNEKRRRLSDEEQGNGLGSYQWKKPAGTRHSPPIQSEWSGSINAGQSSAAAYSQDDKKGDEPDSCMEDNDPEAMEMPKRNTYSTDADDYKDDEKADNASFPSGEDPDDGESPDSKASDDGRMPGGSGGERIPSYFAHADWGYICLICNFFCHSDEALKHHLYTGHNMKEILNLGHSACIVARRLEMEAVRSGNLSSVRKEFESSQFNL